MFVISVVMKKTNLKSYEMFIVFSCRTKDFELIRKVGDIEQYIIQVPKQINKFSDSLA